MEKYTAVILAANEKIGMERTIQLANIGYDLIVIKSSTCETNYSTIFMKKHYGIDFFEIKSDPYIVDNNLRVSSQIKALGRDISLVITASGKGIFSTDLDRILFENDAAFIKSLSISSTVIQREEMKCKITHS